MKKYVYDLCDISNGSENIEWLNSFRSYSDIKSLVKKIIRITEYYLGEFIKFNITDGWYKTKDKEVLVLEFDVFDENEEYKKYRVLKTIIEEDIEVSKRMKRHMYI